MQNTYLDVTPDATTTRALIEIVASNNAQNFNDSGSVSTATGIENISDNVRFFIRLQIRYA
ncbi:hypothetical protein [Pantoea sp. At-9b]|uniref:hypothetical protein n=1 Tax=Pantoea sp. (strain At-9b) TaxID=592316 RepID=UPI0001B400ED|nr:hypothetical protein [Pantoea sp. At-9b]ADU72173.1 hypothetical protein Pat9b_4863 [Pantoea sp. At-9b]